MIITFTDGSTLTGNTIKFAGNEIIIDDYRIVPLEEIESIETV